MDNFLEIFKNLSTLNKPKETEIVIPKEVQDQYPYGQFPIKYTKVGQETIRKHSENRFSYNEEEKKPKDTNNDLGLNMLLPLIQMLGNKKQPKDFMQIFGKLLFKDNPEMEKLFKLIPKMKSQEISSDDFPDTNKIKISSLNRIN